MNSIATGLAGGALMLAVLTGSSDAAEQSRDVGSFSSIDMQGFMDVSVEVGKRQSVRVVADSDIIDNVQTEVRGGRLVIDMKKGRYRNIDELHVYVTVPDLKSAELSGSGDIDISGLNDQDFSFSLRGSGDAILSADTLLNVQLELRGSGDIEIDGRCEGVFVELQGSGDIEAEDLKCVEASVDLRGSGDVEISASEKVDVQLRGSGNVDVYGDPTRVNSKVRGSGEVSIK